MKKIDSLYQLIKQISKQKGRLKIICDWDDTIQVYQPKVIYELFEECKKSPVPFESFFENWSIKIDEIKEKSDFYTHSPFLTTAEELLSAVKENLVEELIFLSYVNKRRFPEGDKRKEKKFWETFGKLSQIKVSMKLISCSKPEWIAENHPDFNLFIDDLPKTIDESVKIFSADKVFVIPNQELNWGINSNFIEEKNVYHLSANVCSLNERDFEVIVRNENIYKCENRIVLHQRSYK